MIGVSLANRLSHLASQIVEAPAQPNQDRHGGVALDASVPYRQVIEVMDLVRRGGIDEIQLGVAPAPPPAGP